VISLIKSLQMRWNKSRMGDRWRRLRYEIL